VSTIAYDKPVRDLIAGLDATGHVSHRSYRKTSVTLHHNGGRLSHQGVLDVWKVREASAHFDVDAAGEVAQYVRLAEYAWATGSTIGNQTSISIEMANSTLAPIWGVSTTTWQGAARLTGWLFAKVIGVRPSPSNFFVHSHWYSTACAGPAIQSAWSPIMAAAQAAYDAFKSGKPLTPVPPTRRKARKMYLVRGTNKGPKVYLTNGITKRWIESEDQLKELTKLLELPPVKVMAQFTLDAIPEVK
jgi:hypothetical protein